MYWTALIVAGLFEVLGVINLKKVAMKQWSAIIYLVIFFGVSFSLLTYAMNDISMGTAYGVWTGIGTAGSAVLGMYLFGESKEVKRIVCIALILCSAVGLKLLS
ncbi:DMT family transporter [Geomicrobium sediminis]|uniref:Paired small multidrug resistance pump n=1 Tax=Geomicrobium sediminis TaxID=1347788 RepID=A0ABS2P6E3_9BACL|nr:multidrug efflux SMR transporter [Geomicrobium sediminis]MBM7630980.1 paired small multidrug resistance pump [Geomicrobium sediminis]